MRARPIALALFATLIGLSVFHQSAAAEQPVKFQRTDSTIEIMINGDEFATYNFGDEWNKPFLYPVKTAEGVDVLRPIVATKADEDRKSGKDHFHHKGVWVGVDSVTEDKLNYWHEGNLNKNVEIKHESMAGKGVLTVTNHWLDNDEQPLLKEVTTITISPNRFLRYDITLSAVDEPVTFFDTKEGFFAVRVQHTMRGDQTGKILNVHGDEQQAGAWGKEASWVDYSGDVEGEVAGVTLFDHPDNFRPSRYHVRDYGLFGVSPFGPKIYSKGTLEASPVTIEQGDPLKLSYGLYIHDGAGNPKELNKLFQKFAAE